METDKLSGEDLDRSVAVAIGVDAEADTRPFDPGAWISVPAEGKRYFFRPSSSWNAGGPLLERFFIETEPDGPGAWCAYIGTHWGGQERCGWDAMGTGPTLLVAAMRALVAFKTPNVRANLETTE